MEPTSTPNNEAKMQEILNSLEKLKQEWKESAPGVPFPRIAVDEEELRNQLRKNVSTEYTKLFRYYRGWWKSGFFLFPVAIFFMVWVTPYNRWAVGIFTFLSLLAGMLWDTYVLKQLRKLDISILSLTEYSYGLNQLRKYLNWEYPIGFILVIILYVLAFGHTNLEKIIGSTFFCVIFLIFVFRAYRSRIRNVSQSLRELEEFDSDSKN